MERLYPLSALLLVFILSVTTVCGINYRETGSCPENQKAYNGSCYEFVTLQRSFYNAQAGCESGGGHLAFVHNEETQQFLQKHLQPGYNWWFGLASTSFNLSSNSSEDLLSWLDGSEVTYSNFSGEDVPTDSCGYISKESYFQWGVTSNCSQEFFFICEFESGQSLACVDNHAMLKCDPDQVIEIDESFYGRNTTHYCRPNHSPFISSVQDRCSWVDVVPVVSHSCNGRQVCEVPANDPAFGEPCPELGSYLSIKYHCRDDPHSSTRHGTDFKASKFKRSQNDNICSCNDLHNYYNNHIKIKCVSNCGKADRNRNNNIYLTADENDLVNLEWFLLQSDGPTVVSPCKNGQTNGQIRLSENLGNGTFFNLSSAILQNHTDDITIVLKGYKDQNVGYDCYDAQLKPTPIPTPTRSKHTTSSTNVPPHTTRIPTPDCNIYPRDGNIYTQFTVSCTINQILFCIQPCTFYLTTSKGVQLYNGDQAIMPKLLLPVGTNQLIVTITNSTGQTINIELTVMVTNGSSNPSLAIQDAVSLQKTGALSTAMLAQAFETIFDNINSNCSEDVQKELMASMCESLCEAVTPGNTSKLEEEIQIISSFILNLVTRQNLLTPKSTSSAACVLDYISENQISLSESNGNVTRLSAALPIVLSASILLNNSASSDQKTSEILLKTMDQVQSTMLIDKTLNTEPIILSSPLIKLYVNRLTPDNLDASQMTAGDSSVAFSLPSSVSSLVPSDEPVNLRMMSLGINPFAWNNDESINGTVWCLSLNTDNGSAIAISDLSEEIEILLPRQGASDKTFLNLTSYGTTAINVTAPNSSLVLNLEPSDETPLMLHLGFQYYPNDNRYVAKTQFPQTNSSQELNYTWVLNPNDVPLEVGVYYLLVRPILSAGVNSTNMTVFITSFTTNCKYWNETDNSWYEYNCRTVASMSENLGNGTFFNLASAILQNHTDDFTTVLKGYKDGKLDYDCYNAQIKPTPSLTPTIYNHTTSSTNVPPHTTMQPTPDCNIYPRDGNIYTQFTVSCTINQILFCFQSCTFHLTTSKGVQLYNGDQAIMPNLLLPVGTNQLIVTITNSTGQTINIELTVMVTNGSSNPSLAIQDAVSLQKTGALSTAMLAQAFETISDNINSKGSEDVQKELMASMCEALCKAVTPGNTSQLEEEIQIISSFILKLVTRQNLLTPNSTSSAACVLDYISENQISLSESNGNVVRLKAAFPIVLSASILLNHSASSDQKTSEILLKAMDQVQSTMLVNKSLNTDPITLSSPLIKLYVNRLTPDNLDASQITAGESSAAFSLPSSVSSLVPSDEPVNLRMMSFGINPFAWNNESVSGTVGCLSLTTDNGSAIAVSDLSEEIEILLPRQSASNKTFLNLASHSTTAINVTAPNSSLVVNLEPSDGTPLMLHLGFQYYPNDTIYVAKTQFPEPNGSQELNYTWVLNPNDVPLEVGVYYLLVRPIVSAGVNSTNMTVYITSFATNCKYWNETNNSWNEYGCRVGPRTTSLVTQCLCTHLTAFGSSFFVMPNTVDVSRTAELFSTFANNPVVVCFVGAVFLAYIIAVIWAHKKDLQDKIKVRITVLEDNDPLAEYRYLVAVSTGYRHGAATTSHVTLTLTGTVWESKPHHLTDPEKPVFTRGGVDIFMLTTPFSLGDLQSIRLWHDNSGEHPDWYVNKVLVQDLETGQVWHFLCSSWLAIDIGDCTLDKVFPIASENDLKGFHNLFFTKTAKDLCDGHIWYSVLNRPTGSNFTRVQRLSCCFSLLLCTMVTSIMFWGIPKSPSEQDMELGTIKFNVQQFKIGIQSSIIMFPVNLLIVTIFRSTRPRKKKEVAIIQDSQSGSPKQEKKLAERWRIQSDITIEIIVKEIKKIVRALATAVKCPVPNAAEESETTDISTVLFVLEDSIRKQTFTHARFYVEDPENSHFLVYKHYRHYLYKQLRNLEKQLRLLGPSQFPNPEGYIQALVKVRNMKQLLEPYLYSDPIDNEVHSTGPDGEEKKKCCQKGLPWWFMIVGWILVVASSGVSAYFTMIYGLTYGKERSISWLISISVSFFESLFVTQPVKVLGLAIFFALLVKNVESQDENYFCLLKDMTLTYSEDPDDIRISRRDSTCRFYKPPPLADIEKMKENYIKNQKAIALIKEIIIYMAFLCVLLLATYGQRDPNAFYLNRHIQQSFSNGITDSMSPRDVFTWANQVLISNLYGQRPGFITDGNSKLVGNARLRQVRVHKDSCRISKVMQRAVPDCHAPYSWGIEDMGSYGPGWNRSKDGNITMNLQMPWQYQPQSKLRGHPIWGSMAFYRGGGFILDLGLDPQQASSMLQYLFDNTWLDVFTRAIFVEFTVYNANVNLFCVVTLMLETNAVGAYQYSNELQILRLYQTTDGINIVASEVIYFLFILYYMFLQIKRIKQQKLQYFRSKHNLLELSIILLSLAAVGAIINRTIKGNQDLKYFQENRDQFPSFYDTAAADSSLGYIMAFLILLGTVKMWHLLRLNSKLNLITCTLKRAWNDISSFIVVLIIMVLAYSIVSNLLFGWILYTYKTLQNSMIAIIALQLGIFNYEEVLDLNPVIGGFLILSCVIFMTFVVLNLFIAVILEAFSHEQKHYKPSDEEEIVDLMMGKICNAFGFPVKKK